DQCSALNGVKRIGCSLPDSRIRIRQQILQNPNTRLLVRFKQSNFPDHERSKHGCPLLVGQSRQKRRQPVISEKSKHLSCYCCRVDVLWVIEHPGEFWNCPLRLGTQGTESKCRSALAVIFFVRKAPVRVQGREYRVHAAIEKRLPLRR